METEPYFKLVSVSCEGEGIASTVIKLSKTDKIIKIYDHFKKRVKNINSKDFEILQEAPNVRLIFLLIFIELSSGCTFRQLDGSVGYIFCTFKITKKILCRSSKKNDQRRK
jgi:hypothetical protein